MLLISYATVYLHSSVSLSNERNCRASSEDRIAVCEKTAGLRSGNSSDLDSACLNVLVPAKIFMLNENRSLNTFRGHNIRPRCSSDLNEIDLC